MSYEQLKLENQLCFSIYATSRLIIRAYKEYLDDLELTYPQYLVLLVLWEKGQCTVNDIAEELILNTNTLTPLLKRMEKQDIILRKRSSTDERKVEIILTDKGLALQEQAKDIPLKMAEKYVDKDMDIDKLHEVKGFLNDLIKTFH